MNVYLLHVCKRMSERASEQVSVKKRNKEFVQMLVMNGLSFKSENKCSFVLFCRFDDFPSDDAFVVRVRVWFCVSVGVPKTQIPNVEFPLSPTTMAQILINYSCLFGPYTSFSKNSRTPYATFANEIICNSGWILFNIVYFPTVSLHFWLVKEVYTYTSDSSLFWNKHNHFINGSKNFLISSLRRTILLFVNWCWISNVPKKKFFWRE